MRHLLSLKEQSREEILKIFEIAQKLKKKREEITNYLSGKTLIMLFQKTSTRTRLSFEAAMTQLGGHAIFLDSRTSQFSLSDFEDEIRAAMRFGDILMFRAKKAADVEKAASFNQIPVIDACSEKYHPAQSLGDVLTMIENSNGLDNIKKVAWLGIENNVSNTLKIVCSRMGIRLFIAAPEADPGSIDEELNKQAEGSGLIKHTLDLKEALEGVDYIHTDTWLNMEFFEEGKVKPEFKTELERRREKFLPFQVNAKMIENYAPNAKIMHCMPCHIGYEITKDAVNHKNSLIFDQAENRLHIQKAIIIWLLEKEI